MKKIPPNNPILALNASVNGINFNTIVNFDYTRLLKTQELFSGAYSLPRNKINT
jgi:hypothetical protein